VANTFATMGITPTTATEEVTARPAGSEEARVLQLPAGAPVLTVQRVTRDQDGRAVELLKVVAAASAIVFVYEDLPLS
jgi:GntR family transcriptional regulator